MTTPASDDLTIEEFRVISRRAGLDFSQEEMEHLLPLYQQFAEQIRMLHDPALPLGLPAVNFTADWTG